MPRSKICRGCGAQFVPKRSHNVFCSKDCFDEWQRGRPNKKLAKSKVKKTCQQCGKVFKVIPAYSYRKYCSMRCYGDSRVGVPFNVGPDNPQWKDGRSRKEIPDLRKSHAYKKWREKIFRRDDYTCRKCGERGGTLHAHHLYPFADFKHLRLNARNGHTLCEECHHETIGNEDEYLRSIGLDPTRPPLL